jgi:hypothetical protein
LLACREHWGGGFLFNMSHLVMYSLSLSLSVSLFLVSFFHFDLVQMPCTQAGYSCKSVKIGSVSSQYRASIFIYFWIYMGQQVTVTCCLRFSKKEWESRWDESLLLEPI